MSDLHRLVSSPKTLLVFEAAARHGSFSKAAQDFNISQPSVSRNIAQLERETGLALFVRGARGAVLTDGGKELFVAVSEGITRISETIARLRALEGKADREVVLSLSNAFVTNWLAPRLAALVSGFPGVVLRFELLPGMRDSQPANVDLMTCISDAPPDDAAGHVLAPEVIVPVCSAAYLEQHGGVLGPGSDGTGHTFLHLSDHPRTIWEPVLGRGVSCADPAGTWHSFSDYAAILQAALDGTGIALGWVSVVSGSLRNGRLVPAWQGGGLRTGRSIRLISTRPEPMRPEVRDIADWLCERMSEDLDVLSSLGFDLSCGMADSAAETVGFLPNSVE